MCLTLPGMQIIDTCPFKPTRTLRTGDVLETPTAWSCLGCPPDGMRGMSERTVCMCSHLCAAPTFDCQVPSRGPAMNIPPLDSHP